MVDPAFSMLRRSVVRAFEREPCTIASQTLVGGFHKRS